MDNKQKTLKSPLSEKNIGDLCNVKCLHCGEPATEMFRLELKAQIASEAQKSLAREVLSGIEYGIIQARDSQETLIALERKLMELKTFLTYLLKKPE